VKTTIYTSLAFAIPLLIGCGKDKKDRAPYDFEVQESCYGQALTYDKAKNACGPKATLGLLNAQQNNYLLCNGYSDIPNPGAFCTVNEAEIVPAQDAIKKVSVRYGFIADASTEKPIGENTLPTALLPRPVIVSEPDNIERSFEQIERDDIFSDKKFEGYTITMTGKGPFKIVDLNEYEKRGYWLESGSGLVIYEIKIEQP
jgi:hypothetical protein